MAEEGWQQKRRRRKEGVGLAVWCDSNLPMKIAAKVAALVSKQEASPRLVGILTAHRARNEVLNKAQRIALEGEVKGAGSWTTTALTASTSGSATTRPTRSRAAFSDDAKNSLRPSYASVTAGAKDPQLLATQRKLDAAVKKTRDLEKEINLKKTAQEVKKAEEVREVDEVDTVKEE